MRLTAVSSSSATEVAAVSSTDSRARLGAVWHERACADLDPDVFFPDSYADVRAAQRICASCPVLALCAKLAPATTPSGCVVASVWVPRPYARREFVDAAFVELERVAATGEPAPAAERLRCPKDTTRRWQDPEFRARVEQLLEQGRDWDQIAAALECSTDIARKAHETEHGIVSPRRAPRGPRGRRKGTRRGRGPKAVQCTAPAPRPEPAPVPAEPVRPVRKSAWDFGFQQQVAQLRLGEDLSWSEIATRLECGQRTARTAFELVGGAA